MDATESWRNRKTLILSRTEMMGLLTAAEYNGCVEQAYRMHGEGRFYMDPKAHIVLDKFPGEWEAMPSYIEEPEAAACKWVSIRERNREKYDLPTVFSILIYTHPETGFPLAICDGSYHTVMRTGSAAAVSAKWLARKDSKKLAIVGAGNMAEGVLATCNEVFAWEDVRVWSRSQKTLDDFVRTQQPKYSTFKIRASTDLEDVVRGADVVVTVTPARGPIVMNDWINPGTHIAALGADKGGGIILGDDPEDVGPLSGRSGGLSGQRDRKESEQGQGGAAFHGACRPFSLLRKTRPFSNGRHMRGRISVSCTAKSSLVGRALRARLGGSKARVQTAARGAAGPPQTAFAKNCDAPSIRYGSASLLPARRTRLFSLSRVVRAHAPPHPPL